MINDPQIIIVYEPGMFGTMICNVFAEHKQYRYHHELKEKMTADDGSGRGARVTIKKTADVDPDRNLLNSHNTGYKDNLDYFHSMGEFYGRFSKIKNLKKFFQPLENKGLSIHRLSGWMWLTVDYKKYFNNFVIGSLVPDNSEINIWAERYFESLPNWNTHKHILQDGKWGPYPDEYWYANVKKNMSELPFWFRRAMSIKERKKMLNKNLKFIKQNKQLNETIQINPKILFNNDKFQHFCNQCCEKINIPNFQIPKNKIKDHLELNKKKIGFDKILK